MKTLNPGFPCVQPSLSHGVSRSSPGLPNWRPVGCGEEALTHFGKQAAPGGVRVPGPTSQARYLLRSLHIWALFLAAASLLKSVLLALFLGWMRQVLFGNVFFSPHHFCPGRTWWNTKWHPHCQGQSKYLFGKQRDGCFIGFEGGTQRAGSRADHTPSLSEELGWGRSPLGTQGFQSLANRSGSLRSSEGWRSPVPGTGLFWRGGCRC